MLADAEKAKGKAVTPAEKVQAVKKANLYKRMVEDLLKPAEEAQVSSNENELRGKEQETIEVSSDQGRNNSEKKENVKLSDEIDDNGRQFVLTSKGDLVFGEIHEDTGLTAAPILLSEGMITNPTTNDGYGLAHIEARHGDQIRKAGYKSVVEFIETVAKNYDVIREGNIRDGHQTYRLLMTDKHNNTLMVELSGDGSYWNINTAGIFKTSYGKKRKEVYNRHTTAKQPAETVETSQNAEQGDTQTSSRMNVPTSSSDKDKNINRNVQGENDGRRFAEQPELNGNHEGMTAIEQADGTHKWVGLQRSEVTEGMSEREVTVLDEFAKRMGLPIVAVDIADSRFNGKYADGVVYINVNRDQDWTMRWVAGHELLHDVERLSPEAYNAYKDAVRELFGEEYFEGKVKDTMYVYAEAGQPISREQAEREVVNDFGGDLFSSRDGMKIMQGILDKAGREGKPKVVKMLLDWWDKVKDYFTGTPYYAEVRKALESAYADAMKNAESIRLSQEMDKGVASISDAARVDADAIDFSIKTEPQVAERIREFAESEEGKKLGWDKVKTEAIINETEDLIDIIHNSLTGNTRYDEWAGKDPTMRVDWRDGELKPTVTWTRGNVEYKYDMSADLLCINNEGLEKVLSSADMVKIMQTIDASAKDGFTSEDYLRLYETLRDMGFVVPCKGCFDAAARFKMLPSVAKNFVDLVNKTIDERNKDPEAFDAKLRAIAEAKGDASKMTIGGLPTASATKADAIRVGVAGDQLTEHITMEQLMSAEGQTKMLADWGGIFRAWQRTGAGRPKDKLLPEPYVGDLNSTSTTIIGKYGEKTPSYRALDVNQGTGLRRNSHSEFRPLLAIDEIQFMRDAFMKGLTVFKYMKELDDVRLFGNLGVKFNMSFFPAFDEKSNVAGLDSDGNYIASEESVGGREFPYKGNDGKQHYDGMRGLQEAEKHINEDVSLSSVIFSVPHLIKALTDVPTPQDKSGRWGSLIPFHSSGATTAHLAMQGLGRARANGVGHPFSEAFSDYGKGVTNFEDVQNDRFGKGWVIIDGKKAGEAVKEGHKLEFVNGNHYYNEGLGLHLFEKGYVFDKDIKQEHNLGGGKVNVKEVKKYLTPFEVDYNDKVREINSDYAYKEAADYYLRELPRLGLIPRFSFDVPEDVFLRMCEDANVDPTHPKLGWKGKGNGWNTIDSDAYYSLFCDYGMTDPTTGKWSPHRPVGVIDEQGNRTFKLPGNTLQIIKDGVERYTSLRDREDAKVGDAMAEYIKRSVEAGRLTEEQAQTLINADSAELGGEEFSIVSDKKKIKELENSELVPMYRTFQEIDGKLYPPMAAIQDGKRTHSIGIGEWWQSDERPDLAEVKTKGKNPKAFSADDERISQKNGEWIITIDGEDVPLSSKDGELTYYFNLRKGDKGDPVSDDLDAAYNPYIHASESALNDQFKGAYLRPNLVLAEILVPKSELENPYKAKYAKDATGYTPWNSGMVMKQMQRQGANGRTVALSRYGKVNNVFDASEWADRIDAEAKAYKDKIELPFVAFPTEVLTKLWEKGYKVTAPDNKKAMPYYNEWLEQTGQVNDGKRPDESIIDYAKRKAEQYSVKKSFGGNSGYVGYSKSKRAVDAEDRGLRSVSNMDREFAEEVSEIVSRESGKEAKVSLAEVKRIAKDMRGDEWHHTSKYGNRTQYYSAESIAERILADREPKSEELVADDKERESALGRVRDALVTDRDVKTKVVDRGRETEYTDDVFTSSNGYQIVVGKGMFDEKRTFSNTQFLNNGKVGKRELYLPEWYVDDHIDVLQKAMDEYNARLDDALGKEAQYSIQSEAGSKRRIELRKYDRENNSELIPFLEYVKYGNKGKDHKKTWYKVGVAGELLNKYGISGDMNVSTKALNPNFHTNDDLHKLTPEEWTQVMYNINTPLGISSYSARGKADEYRLFTTIQRNGKNICVGIRVKKQKNGNTVSDIVTAFGRDISTALKNENFVYKSPELEKIEKEQKNGQSSPLHNPQVYDQSSTLGANVGNNSEPANKIGENFSIKNGKKESDFKLAEQNLADEMHYGKKVAEKLRQIEEMKQGIKDGNAQVKDIAKQMREFIEESVPNEMQDDMTRLDFKGVLKALDTATTTKDLEKPMRTVDEIGTYLASRALNKRLGEILSKKYRSTNAKGVAVARAVDNTTRVVMDYAKQLYRDMGNNGVSQQLFGLRLDRKDIVDEMKALAKSTGDADISAMVESVEKVMKAKQDKRKAMLTELRDEMSVETASKVGGYIDQLLDTQEKIDSTIAKGEENISKAPENAVESLKTLAQEIGEREDAGTMSEDDRAMQKSFYNLESFGFYKTSLA